MTDQGGRPRLLALDGNNLAMRAIRAAEGRGLVLAADGGKVNTGPLLIFIGMVMKYVRHVQPDSMVVCFDQGQSIRRLALYPDYKANRRGGGPPSRDYFAIMREWLSLSGIFTAQWESLEADDLIAAYWRQAAPMDMVIVSGDKDLLQLVSGPSGVVQIRPQQSLSIEDETWDEDRVVAEMGCYPENLPILKALMGDSSDNIPGIPGVGPKRAAKIASDNNWVMGRIMDDARCNSYRDLIERNFALVNLRDVLVPGLPHPPAFRPTEPESLAWPDLMDFYDRYQLESVKARTIAYMAEGQTWQPSRSLYPT